MKKRLVWLLVFLSVLLLCTVALADWQVDSGEHMTYLRNGKKLTGTQRIDKVLYYFDNEGNMLPTGGVVQINGAVYRISKLTNRRKRGGQPVALKRPYVPGHHICA